MIKRDDIHKNFKLTKLHIEEYYNHSYNINNIYPKDLLKGELSKENQNTEIIRINYLNGILKLIKMKQRKIVNYFLKKN